MTKFQEKLTQAKSQLSYYIDKNHPNLPNTCQICGSSKKVLNKIPDPNKPYQINIFCEDCLNRIYNHTGAPISEIPDTLSVKDFPTNTSQPNKASIRKKLSRWRKKHPKTLKLLECQGCGTSESDLYLIPPDLHHPHIVNVVCPSCNYHYTQNKNYPDPINLNALTKDVSLHHAQRIKTLQIASRTQRILELIIETHDLNPTKCSLCGESLTSNYDIIINHPTNFSQFYTVCSYCKEDALTPDNHVQLHKQIDEGIGLGGSIYKITDLILQAHPEIL